MPIPATPEAGPARSILLVSEPGVDGVFHYVRELALRLIDGGWRVHLAYSSVRPCAALHTLVGQVRAAGGRTLDLRVGNAPRPADARAIARLWSLARAVRPGVIHAHSSKAGALARMLPFLGIRARFFYTPHAYFHMHAPVSPRKRFYSAIERALGQVGVTINVSPSEAEYARRVIGLPPARQRVVVGGTDCARFRPVADPAEKRALRERLGLPPDALLLGTVARYSEQKDPLTLYRALLASLERGPAFCFAHLGQGELSGDVDRLLEGAPAAWRARIYRLGSSDDAPTFYRALDAFTLPSRYEGFSLSALEALATGLPLIMSECLGNDDLKSYPLDQMRWTRPDDPASLSGQISAWAASPPAGTNHREIALREFNSEAAYVKIVDCYTAGAERTGGAV